METASTEVTSIRHRNNVKKSTWRTHRYFVDFESRIPVEMSKLNWCLSWLAFQNRCNFWRTFHVKFPRRIDGESTRMCPLGNNFHKLCKEKDQSSLGLPILLHFCDFVIFLYFDIFHKLKYFFKNCLHKKRFAAN